MTKRTSGSISGFGNYLDDVKKNVRDGLGTKPTSTAGLKVARVLYVYRQGENADQLKDWSYGSTENSQNTKIICEVDGITDYFSPITEEDFNNSLSGQLNAQTVRQTSIYQYPLFVSRNVTLPVPKVGDFVLVSFSDSNGINFGFYEDFYQNSAGRPTFGTGQIASFEQQGPALSSGRALGGSSFGQPVTIGAAESDLFGFFKKTYNKQSFRFGGGLEIWKNKLSTLSETEKIALSFRIATWDAVMGGDFHTNPPFTGFDCLGQNAKTVSLARYLQTGVPLEIPVGKNKSFSYIKDGKFFDNSMKAYLSFAYSAEAMYSDVGHLDHLMAERGFAVIQNKYNKRGNDILKQGHIKTMVDRIGSSGTVWCNGTSMGRTTLIICGEKSIKNTQWEGIDEGKVRYMTTEQIFAVKTNQITLPFIPARYEPRTWMGELKI